MRFELAANENTGEFGWRDCRRPSFDPRSDIAHDILEHFPHDPDTVEAELTALGTFLWSRLLHSDNMRGREAANLAMDFAFLFSDHVCPSNRQIREAPKPLSRLHSDRCEEMLALAVLEAKEEIFERLKDDRDYIGEEDYLQQCQLALRFLDMAPGWIRHGIRKAKKRFAGLDAYEVSRTIERLNEATTKAAKYAEEGYNLVVSWKKQFGQIVFQTTVYDWNNRPAY